MTRAFFRRALAACSVIIGLGVMPVIATAACPKSVTANFDGLCNSDIVFQNTLSSQVVIWAMNGTTISRTGSPGSPPPGWSVVGVGDFDGDGKADFVWQNLTTSALAVWMMSGATITSSGAPGSPGPDWSIQGVGDFDGDGKSDLLWQSASTGDVVVWFMNGATIKTSLRVASVPGWTVVGVGDFDSDGKSDVLWQNQTTGEDVIWFMNAGGIKGSGTAGNPGIPWSVAGVGDFNGDGFADILWQNTASGQLIVWLMNGTTITASGSPGNPGAASTPWSVQQVGDFDGDGKSDILFYNNATSQVAIWLMNGTAIRSTGTPGTPGLAWQVQTPAPYACTTTIYCNLLAGMNNTRINGSFGPGNLSPSATAGGPLNSFIWSPGAATIAQTYAATCPGLSHNANRGPFGENIYIQGASCDNNGNCTTPVTVTGTDAAQDWASEAQNYTYSTNGCTADCGHYTQVVWRSTTAVGCGYASCPATNSPFNPKIPYAIEVCDFAPPGNSNGQQPY